MLRRPLLGGFVFSWIVVSGSLVVPPGARGEEVVYERCTCAGKPCDCIQVRRTPQGTVYDSPNFRVHHNGPAETARKLTNACELHRLKMEERWLGTKKPALWTPRCDVYCYSSGTAYRQATGSPADTWGYSAVEAHGGQIHRRTVHVRIDQAERVAPVVTHEITHIVLADRFRHEQIPRWADEGIAVLSEPGERLKSLLEVLQTALPEGRVNPWSYLVRLEQYPTPLARDSVEIFYATCATWVDFLSTEKKLDGPKLLQFVSDVRQYGPDVATGRTFPKMTVATLERQWRDWLVSREATDLRRAGTDRPAGVAAAGGD